MPHLRPLNAASVFLVVAGAGKGYGKHTFYMLFTPDKKSVVFMLIVGHRPRVCRNFAT